MKKLDLLILFVILCLAFTVRLYKINTPLADWHSWRQVDTAAVARNYVRDGVNLLLPKFDDLSSVPSGTYNPEGYRFVEFPIYNAGVAVLSKYLPFVALEVYGRLITIVFSLISITTIYYLVIKQESRLAAITAAGVFSIFPFFVYYSRVVLPDITALGFVMLSNLFLYMWKYTKKTTPKWTLFVLSLICASVSILIKPTAGFYFIPIGFIFLSVYRTHIIKSPLPYIFFILSVIPFFGWRHWISAYPEGIPGYTWLITTVNTFEGPKNIFFRPAFFRWIFYERILLSITGGYASALLLVGAMKKTKKNLYLYSFGIAALAYLLTFQGGNVQHDYYQIMILPAIAIFIGLGVDFFMQKDKIFSSRLMNGLIIIGIVGFSIAMSYERVKDYYNYAQDLVQIGSVIRTITPKDAKIVTD